MNQVILDLWSHASLKELHQEDPGISRFFSIYLMVVTTHVIFTAVLHTAGKRLFPYGEAEDQQLQCFVQRPRQEGSLVWMSWSPHVPHPAQCLDVVPHWALRRHPDPVGPPAWAEEPLPNAAQMHLLLKKLLLYKCKELSTRFWIALHSVEVRGVGQLLFHLSRNLSWLPLHQ